MSQQMEQEEQQSVGPSAMVSVSQSRAIAEIQGMMAVAKRFPRNYTASYNRIIQACKRRSLAEQAMYAYPKGGQTVSGPSIRMAEVLAQNWGNIDNGVIELEQRDGESTMMAYALDLETNYRKQMVWTVKHVRDTKKGRQHLSDARDIYELTANQGSRRLRACILAVIPGDVIEAAEKECDDTLKKTTGEPLIDRIRKMVTMFSELGVTQEMIEKRLAHNIDVTIETELVTLGKIYRSVKDGFTGRAEWFEFGTKEAAPQGGENTADALNKKVKEKKTTASEEFNKAVDETPDPRNVK